MVQSVQNLGDEFIAIRLFEQIDVVFDDVEVQEDFWETRYVFASVDHVGKDVANFLLDVDRIALEQGQETVNQLLVLQDANHVLLISCGEVGESPAGLPPDLLLLALQQTLQQVQHPALQHPRGELVAACRYLGDESKAGHKNGDGLGFHEQGHQLVDEEGVQDELELLVVGADEGAMGGNGPEAIRHVVFFLDLVEGKEDAEHVEPLLDLGELGRHPAPQQVRNDPTHLLNYRLVLLLVREDHLRQLSDHPHLQDDVSAHYIVCCDVSQGPNGLLHQGNALTVQHFHQHRNALVLHDGGTLLIAAGCDVGQGPNGLQLHLGEFRLLHEVQQQRNHPCVDDFLERRIFGGRNDSSQSHNPQEDVLACLDASDKALNHVWGEGLTGNSK